MNGASVFDEKQRIRRVMKSARAGLVDRAECSRMIMDHVRRNEAYQRAKVILFYVDVREEVQTRSLLEQELDSARVIAVPYCQENALKLVHIKSMQELKEGAYGILEPSESLRQDSLRVIEPWQVDLALIPGLAFDSLGARLGHGKGYYDKLLSRFREDCFKMGIAFNCQLVPSLPVEEHDMRMDGVVTELELKTVNNSKESKPCTGDLLNRHLTSQ